ncbi:hypothetical protein THII_3732 [Thioploca ingrica]|uniref:TIGR02117 family protein n=1 Tax=Thioploca ingrica TaxID=40754 RepID=A0A090AKE5_9GAMM|nr:hypothetical protein THII_3732 [Thioploca ingrica]
MKILVLLLSLLWLSACATEPYIVKETHGELVSGNKKIYVLSHGWHTSLVIPTEDIEGDLPELKNRFGNTSYIEFGWGDKGFYQAEKVTTGLTLRALFWPSAAVIHAVAVPSSPYDYFPNSEVLAVCLTTQGYASLKKFVANSFYRDEFGHIFELKKGIYGNSQFYEGVGDYYFLNTCNKWTAKGLKSAGMNISTTFKLTAGSVMRYIRANNNLALIIASSKKSTAALRSAVSCR